MLQPENYSAALPGEVVETQKIPSADNAPLYHSWITATSLCRISFEDVTAGTKCPFTIEQ